MNMSSNVVQFTPQESQSISDYANKVGNVVVVSTPSPIGESHRVYPQKYYFDNRNKEGIKKLGLDITDYDSL